MVNDIPPTEELRILPPPQQARPIGEEDLPRHDNERRQQGRRNFDNPQPNAPVLPPDGEEEDFSRLLEYVYLLLQKRRSEALVYLHWLNGSLEGLSADLNQLNRQIRHTDDEMENTGKKSGQSSDGDPALLADLLGLYRSFKELSWHQGELLAAENTEDLPALLQAKDVLLKKMAAIHAQVDFDYWKSLADGDEKKIKGARLLADIHSEADAIIKKEDENAACLQNIKAGLRDRLSRLQVETRLVNQYGVNDPKPRFVDTTK